MKYLFFFSLLALIGCSQQQDCSKFRTGTFKYTDTDLNHIKIIRNDSVQVEYNSKDDLIITTSIEWSSNCSYILTYKNVSNYPYEEEILGKKIYIKILETDGDSYLSQVSSSTTESKIKMIKIKNPLQ